MLTNIQDMEKMCFRMFRCVNLIVSADLRRPRLCGLSKSQPEFEERMMTVMMLIVRNASIDGKKLSWRKYPERKRGDL